MSRPVVVPAAAWLVASNLMLACEPGLVPITFEVTAPSLAPGAGLVVASSHAAFGEGLVLVRDATGAYSASVALKPGTALSYALHRTSPAAVELDDLGVEVAARALVVPAVASVIRITPASWRRLPPGSATTRFIVTVPPTTPVGAHVFLCGDGDELGDWAGAGVRLRDVGGRRFETTLTGLAPGIRREFKVTRGTWGSVETNADGEGISNHVVVGGEDDQVAQHVVGGWADLAPGHTVTGDVRLFHAFESAFVGARDVRVWLPPGYEEHPERRYPVLYMHDGQNLFDAATSFSGEWKVDETAARLLRDGRIEPLIIVGVSNTAARIDDYTPTTDPNHAEGGNAPNYGRFLVEELKPFVDAAYRTRTDAASTGVCGSSLGGLVSMYLGLEYPGTFTRLGVVSPSVWWNDGWIVGAVEALPAKLPLKVWIDIGTAEREESVEDAAALKDALVARGWVEERDVRYRVFRNARHTESAWANRFEQVLTWLFPAP